MVDDSDDEAGSGRPAPGNLAAWFEQEALAGRQGAEGAAPGSGTLVSVITLGDETFEVRRLRPGSFDYRWVSGRHQGDYGFVSTANTPDHEPDLEGHTRSIADFIAEIDPETGFLE